MGQKGKWQFTIDQDVAQSRKLRDTRATWRCRPHRRGPQPPPHTAGEGRAHL